MSTSSEPRPSADPDAGRGSSKGPLPGVNSGKLPSAPEYRITRVSHHRLLIVEGAARRHDRAPSRVKLDTETLARATAPLLDAFAGCWTHLLRRDGAQSRRAVAFCTRGDDDEAVKTCSDGAKNADRQPC
jgi:hypothetical protein